MKYETKETGGGKKCILDTPLVPALSGDILDDLNAI
jgi:hypothetical protein